MKLANIGLNENVGTKMKSKFIKKGLVTALILCTVLITLLSTSISSSALKSVCGGDGGGIDCGGNINANPGTHAGSNDGTSGYFHDHTAQLNGYMPTEILVACNSPTFSLYKNIGYSIKKDYGQTYLHYPVAIDRKTQEPIGGAPGTKYWDTSWNLDTYNRVDGSGINRADVPEGHNPQLNDKWHNWAGKNWWMFNKEDNKVCLPLTGGQPVAEQLHQNPATITFSGSAKTLVGAKQKTVTFEVDQQSVNNAIAIGFQLEKFEYSVIRRYKDKDGNDAVTWTWTDDPKSPVKLTRIGGTASSDPKQTFKMKILKKGEYTIVVRALFTGIVIMNGTPTLTSGLPTVTVSTPINAIAVKSVSRSKKN